MKTVEYRWAAQLLAAVLAAAVPAAALADDKKITLNYSETAGPAEAQVAFAKTFAERAAELSDGSIRINVHPGGTLAGYSLEPVRAGIADITQVGPTLASDIVPWISILEAPYLIESGTHFDKVAAQDSNVIQEIRARMLEDNIYLLGFFNFGVRDLTMKEPILSPAALEGKRMRVIPSKHWSDMWQVFGAVPVPMSSSETVSAIMTNVIEGQENQWHDIVGKGIYDVNKYVMKTEHVVTFAGVWMNAGKWNQMSETQQQALTEAFEQAKAWFQTEYNPGKMAEYEAFLVDKGVTIIREGDGLDRAAFVERSEKFYTDNEATFGEWIGTIRNMN